MNKISALLGICGAMMYSTTTLASELSATVTAASDYTFNGVSQTNNDPAVQGSIDYASDSGFYIGSWASNVDFDDDTNSEIDIYAGQFLQLNDAWSLDIGVAVYTYHGGSDSNVYNYTEGYSKLGCATSLGMTEANIWYSWDYAGTGADHVISELAHTFTFSETQAIRASVDVSDSLDGDKFMWDEDRKSYVHYRVAYLTEFLGFDLEVAAEDTSIHSELADERLVVSVSRTFDF